MKKKHVAIIGTAGAPAKYGGFEILAGHLITGLQSRFEMSVYCSAKKYPKESRIKNYNGARLFYLPFKATGIQSIFYNCFSILHALFYADVLLVLGVSGGFMLPFVRLFTNKKIVTAINGIEWKRSERSRLAGLYLWMAEWMAVKYSHANVSDNEAIKDYTAIRYKTLSTMIECGADHAVKESPTPQDLVRYPFLRKPYAFAVADIEPENNIHLILDAFSRLPLQTLVLTGNWGRHKYGLQLRKKYAACLNIHMMDPVSNPRELDVLRGNCFVYLHGHSAGGTHPYLVEAMYLGLPVIAYGVSYNRATTEGRAFYFRSAEDIVHLLNTRRMAQYRQTGADMQAIAYRRYTWKNVAARYAGLLDNVVSTAPRQYPVPQMTAHVPYGRLLFIVLTCISIYALPLVQVIALQVIAVAVFTRVRVLKLNYDFQRWNRFVKQRETL